MYIKSLKPVVYSMFTSQFGLATFQELNSHLGLIATVLDRTVLDAGNKAANNRDKVSVFVEFTFHFREDRENYKNNKQEKNPRDFKMS